MCPGGDDVVELAGQCVWQWLGFVGYDNGVGVADVSAGQGGTGSG